MFFIISKLLYFIVSPLTWIIFFLAAGFFIKNQSKKRKSFILGFVLLLVFSNPFIKNAAFRCWEISSVKTSSITEVYDVGVMLGGAMRYYNNQTERVVYGTSVDRLIQTISLYRDGKIKKIIISGGSGLLLRQEYKEADLLKEVMIKLGVQPDDIIKENTSKNTYENAVNTADLLKKDFTGKKILLVTSAYHMRRSLACFKKAGVTSDPFSVDENSGKGIYTLDKLIVPETENLQAWDLLLHEMIGYFVYKIAGYA